MSANIKVRPLRENCPVHPTGGVLPAEGGMWPADQFTFRRMRDGDIERVPDEPAASVDDKSDDQSAPAKRR